ncbi:unnamed protein product [Symbiodinium natans]|uniref:Uncharacterized protein n=1 Tax=Symbiodinium natans TaxID=878477 RepID=A0A812SJV0_9DINO|nr:unnamed protein product [Symbiodinium natans]
MPDDEGTAAPHSVSLHVDGTPQLVPAATPAATPAGTRASDAEEASEPVPQERVWSEEEEAQGPQAPDVNEAYRRLAELMRTMNLTSEQIQRVTPCHRVLSCFGRPLWSRVPRDRFHLSKPAARIPQFISHSWHGSAWNKVTMLFVLKVGLPAVLVGSLFALVMVSCSIFDLLPGYARQPLIEPDRTYTFGPWGICAGILTASVVLLVCEPRGKVFVDKICIHQTDPRLKFEGVLNICAFLKNSDSMLVLWDATYVERLWCVFELAAYMKSREDRGQMKLSIRPTILGPSSIASCLGLFAMQLSQTAVPWANRLHGFFIWSSICWVGLFSAVYVWRSYYRQIDNMKVQLQHFSIRNTKANCCERGHVGRNGRSIHCDKDTIAECIRHWFGSVEEFEKNVRSHVAVALTQGLGNLVFPYHYLLAAGAPSLWGQADFIASRLREQEFYYAGVTAIFGLAYWLAAIPFIFACGGLLNYKLRHRYHPCVDAVMPFFVTAFLVLVPGGGLYFLQAGLLSVLDDMLAAVVWAAVTAGLAMLAWRACWREPMLRLSDA